MKTICATHERVLSRLTPSIDNSILIKVMFSRNNTLYDESREKLEKLRTARTVRQFVHHWSAASDTITQMYLNSAATSDTLQHLVDRQRVRARTS